MKNPTKYLLVLMIALLSAVFILNAADSAGITNTVTTLAEDSSDGNATIVPIITYLLF